MSSAKLTLIGFNNYMQSHDDDLFKLLEVPDGIDKDVLVDNILIEGGEFEVYHANPVFVQNAIGVWSKKHIRTFTKWITALNIEYNPLENYDRKEDYTDVTEGTNSGNSSSNSNSNDRISAYNSDTMRDNSSNDTNINTATDGRYDSTITHNARIHGNIGVTTSQQMLESELDIATWNIYEKITDLFLNEFVIPLY